MKSYPLFLSLGLSCAFAAVPDSTLTGSRNLLINGSFETGTSEPQGWHLQHGASWVTDAGHGGKRSLTGVSSREELICESDVIHLKLGADYRLDGWVHCISGVAKLGVDFLDEKGHVVSQHTVSPVHVSPGWSYVATEFNSDQAGDDKSQGRSLNTKTLPARVWFRTKGRAGIDDLNLGPASSSFMGNKGLEPDERGRIGFWGEEKDDALLPGRRAGKFQPDSSNKHEGKSSAALSPSADWVGFSSLNYGLAPWTDRYELSLWARCDTNASAQILACWTDDQQKMLRVDASPAVHADDWLPLSLSLTAPANATSVRLVASASGGRVWFDDSDLIRLRPQQPRVRVFVNQVGYERTGPKNAVIAANFFPADGLASFKLVTPAGKEISKQTVHCGGRIYEGTDDDWGWYFWRADFSSCHQAGTFHARAQLGKTQGDSVSFQIADGRILQETAQSAVEFFFIQRCGFEVPGWHKACHLDDAKLPDGTHIDATGGWHSAGDYNKLMYDHGDGGVVFALIKALQDAPECFSRYDRNGDGVADALDEASWGARFVAKMQVPETGALRNTVSQGPGRNWTKWSIPEIHTDNVIGNADDPVIQTGEGNSPLVIGGWARLSVLLDQRGHPNDYLKKAVHLWNYATKGGTIVGSPYLLLSSLDLHAVTGQDTYLDYARRSVEPLLAQQVKSGRLQGAFGTYGESTAASLASYALAYKNDPLNPKIIQALKEYVRFCSREADNPFGFSQQPIGGEKTQFFPPDLGNNFQILGRAWAAALIYQLTREPAALVFAVDQMDWVLGKNPIDLCLFEGKGVNNPPRYHHRYNQIPGHERGAVPGTVPNGFVRELGMADRAGFDMSKGGNRSPSFRTSEPWLVHNLFYLLASAELHHAMHAPTR